MTQREFNTPRDILQENLSELTFEIAFTQRRHFLEFLVKRREFTEGFIRHLGWSFLVALVSLHVKGSPSSHRVWGINP